MQFGFKAEQLIADGTADAIAIGTIKDWLNGTKIPHLSDEQIVLFLASCEEDIEFTQRTIKMFYHIRSSSPQLFSNRSLGADDIQSALQSVNICEWRDEDGHVFIFYSFKSDSPNWNLRTTIKLILMVTEAVIYDGPPKGLDLIIDANEVGSLVPPRKNLIVLLSVKFGRCS
ncbi:hypothetical protein RI129_012765 [Pyrocoelia pectoralis]|uniref:Uncharacterized protein n=1 Tax=Pyrocoelia pectoralis TaxID=417401 RepID=A0AAN7UU82_9COLE